MRFRVFVAATILIGFGAADVSAQCDISKFITESKYSSSDKSRLAMSILIDETNYNALKREASGNATIPINGVPVPVGANYGEFRQNVSTVFQEMKLDAQSQSTRDWAKSTLESAAAVAYGQCLQSTRPVGHHIWVVDIQPTSVKFQVTFYTAAGDPTKRTFTLIERQDGGAVTELQKVEKDGIFESDRILSRPEPSERLKVLSFQSGDGQMRETRIPPKLYFNQVTWQPGSVKSERGRVETAGQVQKKVCATAPAGVRNVKPSIQNTKVEGGGSGPAIVIGHPFNKPIQNGNSYCVEQRAQHSTAGHNRAFEWDVVVDFERPVTTPVAW